MLVACEVQGQIVDAAGQTQCPFSPFFVINDIREDVRNVEDGTVVNLTYSSKSEIASHKFTAGRNVIPSSFGGAQEQRNVTYIFNVKNTERLVTNLILNASETETIDGVDSSNDRKRYRIEPSIAYKLNRNWNLNFLYRYIDQNITSSDADSTSNAIYVNLYLHWPKLATTY